MIVKKGTVISFTARIGGHYGSCGSSTGRVLFDNGGNIRSMNCTQNDFFRMIQKDGCSFSSEDMIFRGVVQGCVHRDYGEEDRYYGHISPLTKVQRNKLEKGRIKPLVLNLLTLNENEDE